jgi:chromosome partitioning protein
MIVTVANHKGGVGKTSLAAHLVFRAAERCRVLAVDLDAQGNLSATLSERGAVRGHATADQLFTEIDLPEPMTTPDRNIDLLPSAPALTGTDRLNLSAAFQARTHLRSLLDRYGLIVIDTAPALGLRLTAALSSSQRIVVPLVPESYAVDGVSSLLSEAAAIQEHLNHDLQPADFVLNGVNPRARQHIRITQRLSDSFRVVQPHLSRSVAVAEALSERRPVWRRPTSSKAAHEWRTLCDHLLSGYDITIALPPG